jgi:hypothetical protein
LIVAKSQPFTSKNYFWQKCANKLSFSSIWFLLCDYFPFFCT